MSRPFRIVVGALVAVAALLAVGIAVIIATFDPEAYKPLLIERVQKDWQRTLAVPGRVRLSFWPKLGVQVGEVSLSERGGPAPFASARSVRVALAVMPLLRRQVVVDRVQIDGLRATLVRRADGRSSIDDLLGAKRPDAQGEPSSATAPVAIDIAGLALRDAAIVIDDRGARRKLTLSAIEIDTGRLAPGVASSIGVKAKLRSDPAGTNLAIALQGRLRLDPAQQRHALDELTLTLDGGVAGQPGVHIELGGAIEADLKSGRIDGSGLALAARWPRAGGAALQIQAGGQVTARLDTEMMDAKLSGTIDGSKFAARVGMTRFTPAAYVFDVGIDRLDLDRVAAGPGRPAQEPGGSADAPPDLSALRELNAQGRLRIGAIQVAQIKATDLRAELRAAGGRVDVGPVSAALYDGRLAGKLSLDARADPRVTVQQTLSGVQLGPLLKDALGRDSLEGLGDIGIDVAAQGRSVAALTRTLSGQARVELRNGAVRGVNVAQVIRGAKARLLGGGGGEQAGAGSRAEKTDFSELTASFRIDRGVARNDDLLAKSPLLRITGSGDIDLGAQRLDYLVKATVVATLEGQGGPELQALRGQTVPVKLSGPFDAIGWRIDLASMASQAVKRKIEDRTERAKDKLREQLGGKLKGLFGR